jgi:uncharacterized protein YjbI with pentapeptide repeats
MRLRGPTVRLTPSSTTCGPNALATSRATRPASELRAEVEEVEDTTAPARVEQTERRPQARRYIASQDSGVTQADRPEFSRLELDEDGEIVGARVVGARHAGEDFARARFVDVELVRCDLSGCDFTEGTFHRVTLHECRATSIEVGLMTWRHVTVTDCRLDDANLRGAQLEQVCFETVNCARADFGGARLEGVRFPGSDLAAADFSNARCTDLDLRDARLEGLKGIASLRGATIGVDQLFGLAGGFAVALGISVREREDDQ